MLVLVSELHIPKRDQADLNYQIAQTRRAVNLRTVALHEKDKHSAVDRPIVRPVEGPIVDGTRKSYEIVHGLRTYMHWRDQFPDYERAYVLSYEHLSPMDLMLHQAALGYREKLLNPLELGRVFIDVIDHLEITSQEFSRRTGITPGTVHHYMSMIQTLAPALQPLVASRELTFKVARSIADIEDYGRQIEAAKLFGPDALSSVYVESLVREITTRPDLSISVIAGLYNPETRRVLSPNAADKLKKATSKKSVVQEPTKPNIPRSLKQMDQITAYLATIPSDGNKLSTVLKMDTLTRARILLRATRSAIATLESELTIPRSSHSVVR